MKLKKLINEHHILGDLPSSKLKKMKWNPVTDNNINEAVAMSLQVEEPFNFQKHKNAANAFEIKADPITVKSVDGIVAEDKTDVLITFSNNDNIGYVYRFDGFKVTRQKCTATVKGKKKSLAGSAVERVMGQTGTVVGDLCLLYKMVSNQMGR